MLTVRCLVLSKPKHPHLQVQIYAEVESNANFVCNCRDATVYVAKPNCAEAGSNANFVCNCRDATVSVAKADNSIAKHDILGSVHARYYFNRLHIGTDRHYTGFILLSDRQYVHGIPAPDAL